MLLVKFLNKFIKKLKIMNDEIWKIPYSLVNENWDLLQRYLEFKGNPKYILIGNIDLTFRKDIFDLGNLVGIEGNLWLDQSSIESLGDLEFVNGDLIFWNCKNIKTLGNLKKVGGYLSLNSSSVVSLGELEFVGVDLLLYNTNIPHLELNNVEVVGYIYR